MTPSTSVNSLLPDVLTVEEAAKFLRISTKTVYALIKTGRLSAYRAGRALRIHRDSLLKRMDALPQAH